MWGNNLMLAGRGIPRMRFGDRVRAARLAQGLKQGELAERAGIDQATVSRIERNRQDNPTVETIERLARALGISASQLLQEEAAPAIERPPREVLQEVLSASQVAVVEADWDRWTPAMQRRFLRNLDELRAGQAAIEEARRQLLEFDPLPDAGDTHLPLQQNKARAGA